MPIDLRIRPIGRPKVSEDSKLGFQRIVRKFAVEGPKASKTGIDGTQTGDNVALFRPVGEADDEFPNHYLVNQQIEPAKTVDKAFLTREYAEIRNTWAAETVSESGSLKKISRQYAVLKTNTNVSLGYSNSAWDNHPIQFDPATNSKSFDPWDFLPSVVTATEPVAVSYSDVSLGGSLYDSGNTAPYGLVNVSLNGGDLGTTLSAAGIPLKWVRATAKVDISNPGVDLWSVTWVAPVFPFWSNGTGGKGGSSALPATIIFDENGLTRLTFGSAGGGAQHAYTYTFFSVGANPLPVSLSSSIPNNLQPSVSMDFHLLGNDGNHRAASFKQTFSNALWKQDTTSGIKFTSTEKGLPNNAPDIAVSDSQPTKEVFNYKNPAGINQEPVDPLTGLAVGHPLYQGHPIQQSGGHITWGGALSSAGSVLSSSKISPIFSHGEERIWKIALTYVS